jgi:hypothetical protein
MKEIALGALVAVGISAHLIGQQPATLQANADNKVTVVGCVIKGDGGFVLSNPADPWESNASGSAATTVTSASNVAGRTFYWLNDDDDLDEHAGRKVQVEGKLEKDIDQGMISVEREDGMVEIEFKADGERKVTVKVPDASAAVGTSGAISDREKAYRVVIRKIDVKSVKVLASTCQ